MARKPATILEPVTEKLHPDDLEKQFAALKAKVDFLWDMVVFLGEFPHYRTGDYLQEHNVEVTRINEGW
jgi:hypothetical protein